MSDSPAENTRHRTADVRAMSENWDRWKRLIGTMPDIRTEKVRRVREALRQCTYEGVEVLDETVDRIGNEIGVLCRSDFETQ